MLISRSHRFYFLKAKKCAGTTIECVLGQLCQGPEDICTSFGVVEQIDKQFRVGSVQVSSEFHEHSNYKDIKNLDISNLTPIISIRHPYEIVASSCAWHVHQDINTIEDVKEYRDLGYVPKKTDEYLRYSFETMFGRKCLPYWRNKRNNHERFRQYEFYGDALYDPDLITIKFDNLQNDLSDLCNHFHIDQFIPHTKKSHVFNYEECKRIFTKDQLNQIYEYFKNSFIYWGWER